MVWLTAKSLTICLLSVVQQQRRCPAKFHDLVHEIIKGNIEWCIISLYFRKGDDFLKSCWEKWPRKQVAFFHSQTIKEVESNIFTCKPRSIFKTLGLIRLSGILANTNHKSGFACKLRNNTTHSTCLITSAVEAMCMNSVLPAVLFLAWFICRAARIKAWLLGKLTKLTKMLGFLQSKPAQLM